MLHSLIDKSVKDILIDSLSEPIFSFNDKMEILLWNKAAVELTGLPTDLVLGKQLEEVFESFNIDKLDSLKNGCKTRCRLTLRGSTYKVISEKLGEDVYKGTLYKLDHGILNALPTKYLIEVINASPISSIVFNLDGSIFYSNNAYREIWNLSDENLQLVNHKYNLFLDTQLEVQGLIPLIKQAFSGQVIKSPVFEYAFNSTALGKRFEGQVSKLIAHMYPIHDDNGDVLYIVLNFLDVTEQSNLQEAYRESRERLQLALKGGNLGTWDWNMVTGEMIYNRKWAEMLGFSLEEVYEITWSGLVHPDDKERCFGVMEKFLNSDEDEYEAEYRLRTKKGDYKWILDRGRIMNRDTAGKPLRGVGTHMDITERVQNLQQLEDNEAKYRRLVDNAPIGIAILSDEKLLYINNELARIGEVDSPDQVIGADIRKFLIGEEAYQTFKSRQSMVLDKGQNAPLLSTQISTSKGNIVDVEIVSIPIDYNGKKSIQVLIHDISDRKTALKKLAKSQKLLNQLFSNSPMGIVYLDTDFNINNVNKGFERLFGFSEKEVSGRPIKDFIVPPELIDESDRLNRSALDGEIDYVQTYRLTKEGTKKHLLIYALPVIEEDVHMGIFGIYVDIDQRIQAEEELKTRNLELDNFVYKVSHDLRAPLASILGLINLTKLEGDTTDKEYYIDLMEGQVNKLDYFIRDILSHSKNLKMSVAADVIDFNEIVRKCFDDLGYMKASSKVVREIDIESFEFVSDKWRISEIFRNLIGNAIKYRNQEIDQNLVAVTVKRVDNGCTIEVRDNGIGIARDKIPHVMEMFYRGAETSEGSGIGLYIVQKAVEKLGGTLKIDSEPKKGSTFTLWLPYLEVESITNHLLNK